ncbi:MAG TPA: hypothetical protein PLT66_02915, partial [Bacillota bacterium]|nr:hypothetical protein [Bacillota bacterium]
MNTLLKRKVLEMLISRTLREMKTDPERSVRNIVELAHSCSKGKFQKSLFARVSDMLTDKHSAYYTMAKNIVKGVDPQAVTDFGVAIGYDAFTFGTRLIRENEKKLGITIPWIIWIDGGMPKSEYEKLITEGIALGIYTYVFTGETTVDEAAICADKYRHCPFVYLADGANAPDEAQIRRLGNTKNLITLFDSDASEYRSAVQCAGENGLLYGTYKKYADESVGAIVSGSWIDSIAEQAGVCAVLLPDGASDE